MIKRLGGFITILFFLTVIHVSAAGIPEAKKGILDLTSFNSKDDFVINLNGEWEFYWNRLLHPYDFRNPLTKPEYYGKVPSYWTDYNDDIETGKFGYATYRLHVILPAGLESSLGIDMPVFDSSYDIYINDEYLGGNGIPGRRAEESSPEYSRNFFRIRPASDTLSIIINVSNYDHRRGGFWLPVRLGTFSAVQKKLANSWAWQWAVISLLLGFSVFFLFFHIISNSGKEMLFFSIATICLAIRPFFTSHFLINNIAEIPWDWIIRFEYLGLFTLIIAWAWFLKYIYPSRFIDIVKILISVVFFLGIILTITLPVSLFSYLTMIYYPSVFLLIGYPLTMSLRGLIIKWNIYDLLYFSAFFLLIFGGIHDIQVASGKVQSSTGYILTYFIILFVFIQAGMLMHKWITSFRENERLKNDLEFINRNLEKIVDERTQVILLNNREIEKQSAMIAQQNKRLSDTLHVKNRIFSVIAHDLRSPVVNILYMLNLLKEKDYREKLESFANSSIEYAQLVINLLENMLVWGREQEDKIKYSPERQNLADLILTNLSIFKETADKKDISVNFTQVGNPIAYFDKDLLDIVIRNLLSNAVKYTYRGGRISILLKDKSANNEGIMLKICDNGVGISEDRLRNLFSSEEIQSTAGTENEKGTGLGLRLCHDLIKINKGSISVESAPGEGTCFIITLPV